MKRNESWQVPGCEEDRDGGGEEGRGEEGGERRERGRREEEGGGRTREGRLPTFSDLGIWVPVRQVCLGCEHSVAFDCQ